MDREAFRSVEDLQQFVDTRGNALQLTHPRPVKVFDPESDLNALFDELVGGEKRGERKTKSVGPLDETFQRLHAEGRADLGLTVRVPVVGQMLRIPYAYQNGVWNLVKPQRFSTDEGAALRSAIRLAVEGDLLKRHGAEERGQAELIVVADFEGNCEGNENRKKVRGVLDEYRAQSVTKEASPDFLRTVEKEAHS